MKRLSVIIAVLLTGLGALAQGIKSLDELKSAKKYLLENANGYGFCVYNPEISDKDAMLGGGIVPHPSGCVNDAYMSPIDELDANNQWRITAGEKGTYRFYNLGAKRYLTDLTSSWSPWGGYMADYGNFYFTEDATDIDIIANGDGQWAIRLTGAAGVQNADKKFLCAASHAQYPMAAWTIDDAGSFWYIREVNEIVATSLTLNQTNISIKEGNSYSLVATVLPADASGADNLTWSTDNAEVATVKDGVVSAHKAGTCTITVTLANNSALSATCTVTVIEPEKEDLGKMRFITFLDGQLVVIPEKYILSTTQEGGLVTIALASDTTFTYTEGNVASIDSIYQGSMPEIESFKFNNKFNDQLYTDAEGVIDNEAGTINVTVGCIGKRLTPSFKLSEGASAYIGNKLQHSKKTRLRFDKDYLYSVVYPKNWIYRVEKISDEVWSTPPEETEEPWLITPIALSPEMLSSNWPSAESDQQLSNILDGDINTVFHSNWSGTNNWSEGSYYGDGVTTWPYLQIEMAEPIENFLFSYTTRNSASNNAYSPAGFIILGSQDGEEWNEVRTLDKDKDNLPIGQALQFESKIIEMGKPYKYVRFQLTDSSRKNYLVLSEFSMSKVEANPDYGKSAEDFVPELLVPAEYKHGFVPYGRDYKVHVDFLTDHPAGENREYNVPRMDIWFDDGQSWNSWTWIGRYGKETWEDAEIAIDGVGIFPDMERTAIQIRGRGNSSWSNSWSSKNPYRMKFPEKVKPFGMTKGKSWVLLANKQGGSMTTNALAMKIADMVESAACNHIIPVELYVNGQYRGSYNFTEKIGFANNSIDIADDSNAVLLEMDSYYDGEYKFRSQQSRQYVNVKEPEFSDPETVTNITFDDIKYSYNQLDYEVNIGEVSTMADVDALCRAMLVTDLTRNTEMQHPKSWYLYNEDILNDSLWVFGPVWDFDWSYGYEGHSTYFIYDAETDLFNYGNVGTPFFRSLLRNSEVVKKEYYRLWTEFINTGRLNELIEYCDDYYAYVSPSLQHNATMWSDGRQYATVTENSKNWLTRRANFVYSHLQKYDLGEDIIGEDEDVDFGQPDRIDLATVGRDVVDVFTLNGIRVRTRVPYINCISGLMPGIYVVEGKKVVVRTPL
ncbi:MAG: CotH kinase family protein [Bacteroidales bacterium]|nr:CotH kinase family protein [Bacteroidales bacterium]